MATTSSPAVVLIPAAYLDDVRTAALSEAHEDITFDQEADWDRLAVAHLAHVAVPCDERRETRDAAVEPFRDDPLMTALFDADGDTEITADRDRMLRVLEHMTEDVVDRLGSCIGTPMIPDVLVDGASRLAWAATTTHEMR